MFWVITERANRSAGPTCDRRMVMRPFVVACDASDKGWGEFSLDPARLIAHGFFTPDERMESSTHREQHGIMRSLRAFVRFCLDKKVAVQVDN